MRFSMEDFLNNFIYMNSKSHGKYKYASEQLTLKPLVAGSSPSAPTQNHHQEEAVILGKRVTRYRFQVEAS